MRNSISKILLSSLLLLMVIVPTTAYADFLWAVPQKDKSVEYLGDIFGTVGNVLVGTPNPLIGNLFQIFNIAVLALGSLVVSYTIILSTINTAQEGEVMGRKWSSVWIPLRCALGMGFLLPTASGYSLIQLLMMQFVVWGVAAADQVWAQVYNSISPTGTGTGALGTITMDNTQMKNVTQQLFNSMMCAQVLNTNTNCKIALNNQNVTTYTTPDGKFHVGIPGSPQYANLCGGLQPGGVPSAVGSQSVWNAANQAAFATAAGSLATIAQQAATTPQTSWPTSGSPISNAANAMQATIVAAQTTASTSATTEDKSTFGWLFAGSYYFSLTNQTGIAGNYPTPSSFAGDTTMVGNDCNNAILNGNTLGGQYLAQTETASTSSGSSGSNALQLNTANISQSGASALYQSIVGPVQDLTYSILNALTTNQGDPISSLRYVGSTIMTTAENLWLAIMLVGFLLLIGGCIMSGTNPMCWAVGGIVTVLVPILTIIIALLWSAGAVIGLYLPLVPYLVFTFTAIGWFLLVIETMAAAPIVSLGLVSPAAEHLGKASPAVVLIANVFLRPSLMVIGFVAAIKLTDAVISMINFGFESTVKASTGGLGLFGCIALICLYGGFVIAVIHECFSLVHVLPDKIMRWIGGQADSTGQAVKAQLQEVRQASDKGAEMGGSLMKSSAGGIQEKVAKKSMQGGGQGGGKSIDGLAMGG